MFLLTSAAVTCNNTFIYNNTFRTRAFSVAGKTVWNSLPDHLRDPAVDSEQYAGLKDAFVRRTFETLAH